MLVKPQRIRSFVRAELAGVADDIVTDRLGSIFGVRYGDRSGPKVMVAGHMDEVGFMITRITDNGMRLNVYATPLVPD